jgi:hypothetical protein
LSISEKNAGFQFKPDQATVAASIPDWLSGKKCLEKRRVAMMLSDNGTPDPCLSVSIFAT